MADNMSAPRSAWRVRMRLSPLPVPADCCGWTTGCMNPWLISVRSSRDLLDVHFPTVRVVTRIKSTQPYRFTFCAYISYILMLIHAIMQIKMSSYRDSSSYH